MDYARLEKLAMDRLAAMSDEELNADFRRFCEIAPEEEEPDFSYIPTVDFGVSPNSEVTANLSVFISEAA